MILDNQDEHYASIDLPHLHQYIPVIEANWVRIWESFVEFIEKSLGNLKRLKNWKCGGKFERRKKS